MTASLTAAERQLAYRSDVVFSTVQQIGFDLLRDRQIRRSEERRHQALDVVIVDELDAVLIDEALVPLVLAGDDGDSDRPPNLACFVGSLRQDVDFIIDDGRRNVMFSEEGVSKLEHFLSIDNVFAHADLLTAANLALHAGVLLERDVHYLVIDGGISLVNETRGRITHRQRWPDGLHAAVEIKEGLVPTVGARVLDQTLVQTVVRNYRTLVGMSGTAVEGAERLSDDFGLRIAAVPTNLPCARVDEADRLFETAEERERAAIECIVEAHAKGQPVLVGTSSVADSERFARLLAETGLAVTVLNAKHDVEEAEIIARAGEAAAVTISTQMAGRGVDIRLDTAACARGGLMVVGLGRRDSVRLDHQLRGRSGRQGDPGCSIFFTSLEDDVVVRNVQATPAGMRDGVPRSADRGARQYARAQRGAEADLLQIHRKTRDYARVLEHQRQETLVVRSRYMASDQEVIALLRELEAAGLERERSHRLQRSSWIELVRQIVLFRLDEQWSQHLAEMTEIREGIHLRALANAAPLVEFIAEARHAFESFRERMACAVVGTLRAIDLDAGPCDLGDLGLRRPSSTWTYMVEDDPFGTTADRFISALAKLAQGR